MGMEKIIFSKDNTLTLPGKSNFINDGDSVSLKNAIAVFGSENTWVVTDMIEVKEGDVTDYSKQMEVNTAQTWDKRDYDWPTDYQFWKENEYKIQYFHSSYYGFNPLNFDALK